MKKRRSIVVLFMFLCTLLLCICAFLISGNTLAVCAADDVVVELEHGNSVFSYQNNKTGNTSNNVIRVNYGAFDYSGSLKTTTPSEAGSGYSLGESSNDYYFKAAYENFAIKVTMPAGKKYAITFTYTISASKNQTRSDSSSRTRCELFHFGNESDKSAEVSFNVASSGNKTPGASSSYTLDYFQTSDNTTSGTSGVVNLTITYDNTKSGADKEFVNYFGFYAYAGGALNIHTKLTASWSFTYQVLTNAVAVPTIAADFSTLSGRTYKYETEYTGSQQTFGLIGYKDTIMSASKTSLAVTDLNYYTTTTINLTDDNSFWDDELGGILSRSIRLSVVPATPTVVVDKVVTCLGELPKTVPLNKNKSQAGTISWFPGEWGYNEDGEYVQLQEPASYENPKWLFVPEDENYKSITGMVVIDDSHTLDDDHHVEGADATCTEDGSLEYWQCSVCNKYFSDADGETEISADGVTIEALGHNMTKVDAVAATCTADGKKEHYSCSRCGGLFWDSDGNSACTSEQVVQGKLGHDYTDKVVAPTCSAQGYTEHTCSRTGCGNTYKDTYTDMLPHAYDEGEVTTAATCTTTGVMTYTCSKCGNTKTEQIEKIEHTPETVPAKDATCTEKGKTEGSKCSVCKEVLTAQEDIDALGHNFSITVSGTQPTCRHGGTATMKCSRCDETQTQNSADPVDHVYTDYVSDGNATCTQDGTKTAECDFGCGTKNTIADEGSQLAHVYTDYVSDGNATCSEDGTKTATCDNCHTATDTVADEESALGHDYEWVITLMPTEETEGLKESLCKRCGDKNDEEEIAKLVSEEGGSVIDLPTGHDYDLEIAVKQSESKYNIEGINKGYVVELYVVDGGERTPYDSEKEVTLMLVIPEGMEEFTLYRMSGDRLTEVAADEYTVEGGMLSIRTTLPNEYVFNAPASAVPGVGIPWWVWLLVGIGCATVLGVIIVIIVVLKKKNGGDGGAAVIESTKYDDAELKARLSAQDRKLDEIREIIDGGFNDIADE